MRSKLISLFAILFLLCGCTEDGAEKKQTQEQNQNHPDTKIITTDKIEDIEAEFERADENTLVVFDCDGVLTTISWDRAKSNRQTILVNKKMPQLVDELQQREIKTVVLTALSAKASKKLQNPIKWRIETLKSLGYHFEKSFPSLENCWLPMPNNQPDSAYDQGVICCGRTRKDDSLKAFLGYASCHPSKIIFIDDSIRNIQHVEAFCKERRVVFVGIEYTEEKKLMERGE
ncbi:MAG: DUF2608 domain-containing protein [Holosporales bacterium]|jgi:hypothetical protein|nr:DUF2608 domain-containing protein [Holosporales bacterium]